LDASRQEKTDAEMEFWRGVKTEEGTLAHDWYESFFTTHFGLAKSFYAGKRHLDIGCGPAGTLEWNTAAAERVGLDPLADLYRELGTDQHQMRYVAAHAEAIPFPDGHFEIVSSFNSLDHVDDLNRAVSEIIRVLASRGLFLLLTDVNHEPTVCEPIAFSWDVTDRFKPALNLLSERRYEKKAGGLYNSIEQGIRYDAHDVSRRYGILSAVFIKS
jgi:ubiquinone/menaquinone biosynthesis C-methylase UbiE